MTVATELAALQATMDAFVKAQEKVNDEAKIDRAALLREVRALQTDQTRLVEDMAEVKPVTDMVTSVRSRLIGMMILLGVLGTIVWAGMLFFKEKLISLLGG